MSTLHIENTVRDFASWKEAFDRYDGFRAEQGVRAYTIRRHPGEPNRIVIDLEFGSTEQAESFKGALGKIWATPVSKAELVSHSEPVLLEEVERRTLS